MARGLNKVMLIGRLGADPEIRYTADSKAIANANVATTDSWRDKVSGEQQERTEWHRVVFFNRLAEIVEQYLHKGSQVYIEGRLQTRKWQDREGNDRYTTEIVANDMQMLGARAGGGSSGGGGGGGSGGGGMAPSAGGDTPARGATEAPMPDFDDDIPF